MSSAPSSDLKALLAAAEFAAKKHRLQHRKDEQTPYINHLIVVATILAEVAGIEDLPTLQAALLHDTLEDTDTTREEIENVFGQEVRQIVEEVTDDKSLPSAMRKQLQIEGATKLSPKGRLVRLADKISNVEDMSQTHPTTWTLRRKKEYLDWSAEVVAKIRGCHAGLERRFDASVALKRRELS